MCKILKDVFLSKVIVFSFPEMNGYATYQYTPKRMQVIEKLGVFSPLGLFPVKNYNGDKHKENN